MVPLISSTKRISISTSTSIILISPSTSTTIAYTAKRLAWPAHGKQKRPKTTKPPSKSPPSDWETITDEKFINVNKDTDFQEYI